MRHFWTEWLSRKILQLNIQILQILCIIMNCCRWLWWLLYKYLRFLYMDSQKYYFFPFVRRYQLHAKIFYTYIVSVIPKGVTYSGMTAFRSYISSPVWRLKTIVPPVTYIVISLFLFFKCVFVLSYLIFWMSYNDSIVIRS